MPLQTQQILSTTCSKCRFFFFSSTLVLWYFLKTQIKLILQPQSLKTILCLNSGSTLSFFKQEILVSPLYLLSILYPTEGSPPGSPVPGILQAGTLETRLPLTVPVGVAEQQALYGRDLSRPIHAGDCCPGQRYWIGILNVKGRGTKWDSWDLSS